MIRRTLLASAAAALCTLSAGAALAQADAYPSKPIKWIVPFPPAGAMDTIARTLGEHMGRKLGQTFVIENRPGAGGNIGADAVAKAAPDGYTMMIVANGMAVNKFLYGKLSYDPVKDFAPVSLLAVVPNVLVTNAAQSKAKTRGRRDRAGQGPARQGDLRLGRQRHVDPPRRRALRFDGRGRHAARAVQGQRPGGDRPDRRPGRLHVRQRHLGHAAHPVGQAARDRRDHGQAIVGAARMCRPSPKRACPATSCRPGSRSTCRRARPSPSSTRSMRRCSTR